jgi:TDG/mug DNA glycosylase family protein
VRKRGLPPLVNPQAEVLVLGSFPSVASLARREYYAHAQNHFWRIVGALSGRDLFGDDEDRYAARVAAATSLKLAVWDVVAACERVGSGDERIEKAVINDFAALVDETPRLRRVCFNGLAAAKLGRPVFEALNAGGSRGYEVLVLPSTSPRNARMSLKDKTRIWQRAIEGS